MKIKLIALLLAALLLLTACVGGSETSNPAGTTSKDESVIPNTSTPDTSKPDTSKPDTSKPDTSTPETSVPDTSTPDTSDEISIAPEGGIYSGQDTSTHGVEDYKISDFLEDSLFVGDSVTDGFKLYVNNYGDMPSVKFFSCASYGYVNSCKDKYEMQAYVPKIGGEPKYIWEAVSHYESKRVFINFGLNDFGYISDAKLVECLNTICDNIHSASPETEIVFLSCGFFTENGIKKAGFTNDRVRSKCELILNFCKDNGYDFIDVSWAYADANGNLIADYSIDDYCHLGYSKYGFWEEILKAYAADKILNQYKNIETMLMK